MTTQETSTHPEIEWQLMDFQYSDSGLKYYCVAGESEDGRLWSGTGSVFFDELIEVEEIEEVNN